MDGTIDIQRRKTVIGVIFGGFGLRLCRQVGGKVIGSDIGMIERGRGRRGQPLERSGSERRGRRVGGGGGEGGV
jgi:hypothetical protein